MGTLKHSVLKFFKNIDKSNLLIKLSSWEYWPFGVLYLPLFFYWIGLSLKARSLFFFSASNPGIENGGMLGESKIKVLDAIDEEIKAITLWIAAGETLPAVKEKIYRSGLDFPIIAKPDIGERGWMVEKLQNTSELASYLQRIKVDFLIQEYLNLPIEAGVFYYRLPHQDRGTVSSIVLKEMLSVTGDGHSTLEELILQKSRAKLQLKALSKRYDLNTILPEKEKLQLVDIGNHCKGTKFLDGNHLINEQVHRSFDKISKGISGFYYGRYDLRCRDLESLNTGDIKVMELNGAGAEPAHIYQPGFPLIKAYKVLFRHWKILFEISKANHHTGVKYLSFKEGWKEYQKVRAYNKLKASIPSL